MDGAGNLYIGDTTNARVRKISGGVISTVAGNGTYGYSGDGGPAINAQLGSLAAIAVDASGDLYIADYDRVRKISGGIITSVVGGGPPVGASATSVSMSPDSTAVDSLGNVYVADRAHSRVYEITTSGALMIVAGNGLPGFSGDGGPATSAQLNFPASVAVDNAGNVYIADTINQRIRRLAGGAISTVAGGGSGCGQQTNAVGDGCLATDAWLSNPTGIAVDATGNLYIYDSGNNRIRKVSSGIITTVAGNGTPGYSGDGGPATSAQINNGSAVAIDGANNLYIADTYNYRIRMISGGSITTVAGLGTYGYSGDGGPATGAQLSYATGIAVDHAGDLYIADSNNNRLRKVSGGLIYTIAGTGGYGYSGDGGLATSATLTPVGVSVDAGGNVYVADSGSYRLRKITGGVISTIAGNGWYAYSGDGGPANTAQLNRPSALAFDSTGNLYVADSGNSRVRVVSPSGTITTFAGGGTQPTADGIPPTAAALANPTGLASAGGNIYIKDSGTGLVRKVSAGLITTITTSAGFGTYPFPSGGGIAADRNGNVFVSDPIDSRVRMLSPVSTGKGDFDGNGVPDPIWQNETTRQVTVNYYGGAGGASLIGWNWLNSGSTLGWNIAGAADFAGNGVPDLIWQNDTTRQVTVHYYGGAGGAALIGWNWLNSANMSGWKVVGVADFDDNGVPDLIWQNDTTRQVTVNYYGGAGGAALTGWNWLNSGNMSGWKVVGVADFDDNGVPDLIWQNDTTRQVTVNYYGGAGGAALTGWNWLNSGSTPGWHVAGAADFDGNGVPDLIWQNDTTRQVTVHYYGGAQGNVIQGWNWLNSGGVPGWTVIIPR